MIAPLLLAAALLNPFGYGTSDCNGNPPPQYRHSNWTIVHWVSRRAIVKACGTGPKTVACSRGHQIWARNPCRTNEAADLTSLDSDLCHELGHVNGWPDDHPR